MQHHLETCEYIDLTPELAKQLLSQQHPNQRPLNNSWVRELSNAIEQGEYIASQQTLQVDVNGYFFNGQHTCRAVMATNKVLKHIKLERNCPAEAFIVADTSHNRTQVNRFKAATGESVAPSILAVLRVLDANFNAKSSSNSKWRDPYQRKAAEMWRKYRPVVEEVWGLTPKGAVKGFSKVPLAGLVATCIDAAIYYPERQKEIRRFSVIASEGRPPKGEDQSLSEIEMKTAMRWYTETLQSNFDSRNTMYHRRAIAFLLLNYLEGKAPRSLRCLPTNPFRNS